MVARHRLARRHADALRVHLEATGKLGEAAVCRTIVEYLDGRWSVR